MLSRTNTTALAGVLALFLGGSLYGSTPDLSAPLRALAQMRVDHKAEAIKEIQLALDEGKAGRAPTLVTHAQSALEHAQAAEKEKPTPDVEAAITSLQNAVDKGKAGNVADATKALQDALSRLKGQP